MRPRCWYDSVMGEWMAQIFVASKETVLRFASMQHMKEEEEVCQQQYKMEIACQYVHLGTDQEVSRVASLLQGMLFSQIALFELTRTSSTSNLGLQLEKFNVPSSGHCGKKQYLPLCESQCKHAEVMQDKFEGGESCTPRNQRYMS